MPTDVVMPQLGESIAEGTIVRWIKKVGDQVARDEPLFEISTDKVDAEIPSPAAGVVGEIRVQEGETVPVNSVVAVIRHEDDRRADVPPQAPAPVSAAPSPPDRPSVSAGTPGPESAAGEQPGRLEKRSDRLRLQSSPLVRRLARTYNVDIAQIPGTGTAGRVTKHDLMTFVERSRREPGPTLAPESEPAGLALTWGTAGTAVQPMSVMRKKIAEHMVISRRMSAHVHSVFEVSFFRVAEVRTTSTAASGGVGTKPTYLAFIMKAVAAALRRFPVVNASIDGDNVVYHRDVNLGVAVALDWGLIVPVIKKADALDVVELSRAVADLASRARSKQLKPDEVTGGTFTVTNPGAFGALFGLPIINQPQVAILGVGNIGKRPVVVDDAVVVRPMAYLTLGFDHRLIDGAIADQFMSEVKRRIEDWGFAPGA
jgi:2-oxoglutarate dehydrogenase E2 component (dihydrolipoamide succinyltransferase)